MAEIKQKLRFLTVFSLCVLAGFAQLSRSWHSYYERPLTSNVIGNTIIAGTNVLTVSWIDSCFIYGTKKNGTAVFSRNILKHEFTTITNTAVTSDHSLILIGYSHGCDYIDTSANSFIMKMDTLGNILFDITFKNIPATASHNEPVTHVLEYNDSTIYVCGSDALYHFDKNLNLIQKKAISFPSVQSFALLNNGNFVFSNSVYPSGKQLIVTDTALNIITQQTVSNYYSKLLELPAGVICGLNEQKIIDIYTDSLVWLGNSQAVQNGRNCQAYTFSNDTIYAGFSLGDSSWYVRMNLSLNIVSSNAVAVTPFEIKSVLPSENAVFVLGEEKTAVNHNPYTSLIELNKYSGNSNLVSDAEVVQVIPDTAYVTYTYYPGPNYYLAQYYYKMKVMIKNNGMDTLETVTLNNAPGNYNLCGPDFYSQKFEFLGLPPGQQSLLLTPLIQRWYSPPMMQPPSTNTVTVSTCFWTTAPNNKPDIIHGNDELCGSYTFTYTDIKETGILNNLKVYPDPFTDEINVSAGGELISEISLLSIEGKPVLREKIAETIAKLYVSDVPAGFYLLKITARSGDSKTVKVVKK